ncbi:hypothetical protein H4582DRAFT_2070099 [Lactarius indigo]|nr:hypothetical protein H4582DRAFT_2070099 [Lactarius indigo]
MPEIGVPPRFIKFHPQDHDATQVSDSPSGGLTPRRYQEEIFVKAQQRNVIAVLDTGSGKTLICAMLIKWISAQENPQKKVVIFLVPKVPLVEQQSKFIAQYTTLRVAPVHSEASAGVMDRDRWSNLFAESEVLVMTGQIFVNILTHSHWSMNKVSLLVFDECHHTRKNHPYTAIMAIYRDCSEADRPKVFGMTACPTWTPDTRQTSLADLERCLDAKIVTVEEHLDEFELYSSKPTEVIREFPPPPETYPDYPIPTIWSRFDYSQIPDSAEIPWQQLNSRYLFALGTLGIFAAELFLYTDLQMRLAELSHPRDIDEMESLRMRYLYADVSHKIDDHPACDVPELRDLYEILAEYQPFFEHTSFCEDVPSPWSLSLSWFSPKVQTLVDILLENYTPEFHGIVFVDRRHIARVLSGIISRIPTLKGIITCAECVGHGRDDKGIAGGMPIHRQRKIVNDFRDGKINLLIATPVAEEGLDFPACDVTVRFDFMQGMVGYVQSRGRARRATSTFVVMVQQNSTSEIDNYRSFSESEAHIKKLYRSSAPRSLQEPVAGETEDGGGDYVYPTDLAKRERFVVPSTGAILTYNSAIGLLGHLCSLIPCDAFTPSHKPRYSGDFVSTVRLPSTLSLPPEQLIYEGPRKHSKKEAKRAVAFKAVKALHSLGIFDNHLLPAHCKGDLEIDGDQSQADDVTHVPETMDVTVISPWSLGSKLWSHPVSKDGRRIAGLVTGTPLPPTELCWNSTTVALGAAELVLFDTDEDWQRRLMQDYTHLGLWWRVTAKPYSTPLSCYLVPLVPHSSQPNFQAMELLLKYPDGGSHDWSGVDERAYGRTMIMNNTQHGRPFLLHKIRFDLTPLSKPPTEIKEIAFQTYREYYQWLLRKRKGHIPEIPKDGPLVEAIFLPRQTSRAYQLLPRDTSVDVEMASGEAAKPVLFPRTSTCLFMMPEEMISLFGLFPRLLHRVQDIWRARSARVSLDLPPILDDYLIEATTLPSAAAGFNNQRLETLGDSVLKLFRAKAIDLERYLSMEGQNVRAWPTVVADGSPTLEDPTRSDRTVKQRMARRSLQDCMEAITGAGYLSGGIPMALQVGSALGLELSVDVSPGICDTSLRHIPNPQPLAIRNCKTISGMSSNTKNCCKKPLHIPLSAVIDLVVMTYLFKKYPHANSGQLSSLRSRVVCGPVLAFIAVQVLSLHGFLLAGNLELIAAVDNWAHDPPKVLSDIFESLVAAILVDSGYNYDKTVCIVEAVMECVLEILSPDLPPEPVSALFFREESKQNDTVSVVVHDVTVVGPVTGSSISVARAFASERARMILSTIESDKALVKLCNCNEQAVCAPATELAPDDPVDDTTEIGFATAAATEVERYRIPQEDQVLGEKLETEDDLQAPNDLETADHDV